MKQAKLSVADLESQARELGYVLVGQPTNEQKMARVQAEIDRIEALVEPTEKELLEWARENHDYYRERDMLDFYNKDLQAYNELIKKER